MNFGIFTVYYSDPKAHSFFPAPSMCPVNPGGAGGMGSCLLKC